MTSMSTCSHRTCTESSSSESSARRLPRSMPAVHRQTERQALHQWTCTTQRVLSVKHRRRTSAHGIVYDVLFLLAMLHLSEVFCAALQHPSTGTVCGASAQCMFN
eukprot:7594-Heterococcus_DN1.PRE.2